MSRMVILLGWRLICSYRPYRLTLYFNYLIINLKAYYKFFKGKHKPRIGPKDIGIDRNINDFEIDDKMEFVTAIFEGGVE